MEEIMARRIKNPPPKKVSAYNATSFGSNAPTNTPVFEYDPNGPIDILRDRMHRIWNKVYNQNRASYVEGDPSITIEQEAKYPLPGYEDNGIVPGSAGDFSFKKEEKITVTYNLADIDECGLSPAPGITGSIDKWLKVLDGGPDSLTTYERNPQGGDISSHGIVPIFSKLREDGTAKYFYDQVFEYDAPLDSKEVGEGFYGSLSVSQASAKPNYNFYIQTYESILTQEDPTKEPEESMLPSLYSFLSVIENENDKRERSQFRTNEYDPATINTLFEKHITLESQIKETRIATQVAYNAGGRSVQAEADISKGDYFDKYAYAFADAVKSTTEPAWRAGSNPLSDRFKHQIVPSSNSEMFAEFSDVRERFPMFCDIEFSTATNSSNEMISLFEGTELMASFIKGYVDGTWGQSMATGYNLITSGGLPFIPNPSSYQESSFKPYIAETAQTVPSSSLECWDLMSNDSWLTKVDTNIYDGQVEKGVFLGSYNEEMEAAQNNPLTRMTRRLMSDVFKLKTKEMIQKKTRTWKQMVGGEFNREGPFEPQKAYRESIFYIVEKWSVRDDGTPEEKLQSFYFPNSSIMRDYKFSDTQLKYGKKYVYRIYSMEMVFGTKYKYQLDKAPIANSVGSWQQSITQNQARICVYTEPDLKMVKVPLYQKQVIMMDDPPVFPDVEVITYKNVRNQIAFWLTGNSGEYNLKPIAIQPGDDQAIENIRGYQEVGPLDPITFKSDDHARVFEIFRTDQKPSGYSDFIGKKIAEVKTDVDLGNECQFSTSGEWIDKTISPNQTYYYIFRTIDNHGHFSNPSPVYELEMIYDGYAPYLLRNVYPLDENPAPPQKVVKKFTKYLHIKPALSQRVVNEEESGLVDADGVKIVDSAGCLTNKGVDGEWIQLGTADQTLWDKLIKIRVRSRKTGKKIDFNIKFTKKHIKIQKTGNNNLC